MHPILPYSTSNNEENVKDYHLTYEPGVGLRSTTHNTRIDLCAPGYYVKSTVNTRWTGSGWFSAEYDSTLTGSSLSSPMVAGTVGLMRSAKGCLSPYQIEYWLKMGAVNINSLPGNSGLSGKLGSGRLNAYQTLVGASQHNCNNPVTQTMYIDGVEINSLCAPGYSSVSGQRPMIKPRIVNGTAPFTYRWNAIAGNSVVLSDSTAANPEVVLSSGTRVGYYLLTVTDGSVVPKVAHTRVKFKLKTSGYDLAMRDSYFDMMDQPNSQAIVDERNTAIWASPDVWNRKKKDGVETHENVEYFSGGDSNYMYVRIRNVGCSASPLPNGNPASPKAKLYWTLASTGEKWDADWKTATKPAHAGGQMIAGKEITPLTTGLPIPSLQPGSSVVLNCGWTPPNPKLYQKQPDSVEACFLARIETGTAPQFGMDTLEVFNRSISVNVRRQNNIVTRNTFIANLNRIHPRIRLNPYVGNTGHTPQAFRLRLVTDKWLKREMAGDLSDLLRMSINLGDLYSDWVNQGRLGVYGLAIDSTHEIVFDPMVGLDLERVIIPADTAVPLVITCELKDSSFIEFPISTEVHLQQLLELEGASELYGQISYHLNIEADDSTGGESYSRKVKPVEVQSQGIYSVIPNPAHDQLQITYHSDETVSVLCEVIDITGRLSLSQRTEVAGPATKFTLPVSALPRGVYFLRMTDNIGRTHRQKLVLE